MVLALLSKAPFEPSNESSLHDLATKTMFLPAAATARRRNEPRALSIASGYIVWKPSRVLVKNQSLAISPPDIFVPSLTSVSLIAEDVHVWWCPVRALKYYIARFKPLRGDVKQLFVRTTQPYHQASVTTIA